MNTRTYARLTLAVSAAVAYSVVVPMRTGWAVSEEKSVPDGSKSLSWTQATPAAGWSTRVGHATTVFNDRLWIIGGTHDGQHGLNDVWSSANGANWTEETANAPWSGRFGHGIAVFEGKLWILGGYSAPNTLNDVWSSPDGVVWERKAESSSWPARYGFATNVFDSEIVMLAGYWPCLNDIWSSKDGESWTRVLDHAPWTERFAPQSVILHNMFWLMGGIHYISQSPWIINLKDVWYTPDAINWTQVTVNAAWHGGGGQAAAAFHNQIWVLGGSYSSGSGPGSYTIYLNEVWSSMNGATWFQAPDAPWAPRGGHNAVVFSNRLWILGGRAQISGKESSPVNDVWYAETDPAAAFSGAPVSGTAPLDVQFTDESTGTAYPITDWAWDFGDGGTSADQDPNHTYTVRGHYTVSLTVTSEAGEDTETKEGYITVYGTPHAFHTADQDQDNDISLAELLRIIQFYNSDGFHCAAGTEDGYTPGPGDDTCALHDGDYAPPDWQISLSELLRVIQFYNAAGYESCPDGEDGFCVVTAK